MAEFTGEFDKLLKSIDAESLGIKDVMERLEYVQFPDTLGVNLQAKLISRLATCQRFTPLNCLDAEQRVNGLLEYLPSQSYTVCALACSLMRVFCAFLDSNGQHITTQVTISCKNLLTIITKTEQTKNPGLNLCQSVALASLCAITTDWSSKLQVPSQWLPFALLSLNAVFGILLDPSIHSFVHQVASEGLRRILDISKFWTSLTSTEQNKVISHLKHLFDIQFSAENPDPFILIKLLHSAANKEVAWSIVHTSKHFRDFLDVCWKSMPQMNPSGVGMQLPLDLHWVALKLLWTLLKGLKKHQRSQDSQLSINIDKFKPLLANSSFNMDTIHKLKQEMCSLLSELHLL